MVTSGFMIIWHLKSSSRNSNQVKFLVVLLLFLLNFAYHAFGISIYYSLTILNSFSRLAHKSGFWAQSATVRARRASERKLLPGPTTPDQKTKRTTLIKSAAFP